MLAFMMLKILATLVYCVKRSNFNWKHTSKTVINSGSHPLQGTWLGLGGSDQYFDMCMWRFAIMIELDELKRVQSCNVGRAKPAIGWTYEDNPGSAFFMPAMTSDLTSLLYCIHYVNTKENCLDKNEIAFTEFKEGANNWEFVVDSINKMYPVSPNSITLNMSRFF